MRVFVRDKRNQYYLHRLQLQLKTKGLCLRTVIIIELYIR